jgi:hypothetical protein
VKNNLKNGYLIRGMKEVLDYIILYLRNWSDKMSFGIIVTYKNGKQKYCSNDGSTFGEWLELNIYHGAKIENAKSIVVDE